MATAMTGLLASSSLASECRFLRHSLVMSCQHKLQQQPRNFGLKENCAQSLRGGIRMSPQQGRGSVGHSESKLLLDVFFLGKALVETATDRIGSFVGELLSEVGQRQAEHQSHILEFQNEVQARAKTAEARAVQKALAQENFMVTSEDAIAVSTVTNDDEANGSPNAESTSSASEGAIM